MPVYRYVKTPPAEGRAPEHLDVTFAGEGRQALDASMREMGYEFFQVVDGPPRSVAAPFFPGTDAPEPVTPRMPRTLPEFAAGGIAGGAPAAPMTTRGVLSGKVALSAALGDAASKTLNVFRRGASAAPAPSEAGEAGPVAASRGLTAVLRRAPASVLLTGAIVAAFIVHAKAVQGGFVDDDFVRALEGRLKSDWAFVSDRFRGLFAGSYELGYLGTWQLFRMDAGWYLRGILVSHLVNVALVYGVARALAGRTAVAAVAAGLWGITPSFQATLQSLAAFGAVISAGALCWALLELARAAEDYRPPSAFALGRANFALLLCAGGMPGAWLGAFVFPLVAYLLLPPESARARSSLFLVPASIASIAPAVAFVQDVAPALGQPFSVLRVFLESIAYGTGATAAGPLTAVHANARGVGLFEGPSYMMAILASAAVALLVLAFVVFRLVKGESEERRDIAGLLVLAGVLYLGVALSRGEFLGKRSIDWIAARTPQHYAANVPIVLAVAAAFGRVRFPEGFFPRARGIALGAIAFAVVLASASVSSSTHAMRPERAARVTELTDEALRELLRSVPDGEIAFIRNDDFPTVMRARSRGLPEIRFPGVGAYWALAHGPAVPVPGQEAAAVPSGNRAAPTTSGAPSGAPPAGSAAPAGGSAPAREAPASAGGGTPVRFVVMDGALLKTIQQNFRPSIASYFVSPAFVAARGGTILTLDAAESDTLATLEKAKRSMNRVNDL